MENAKSAEQPRPYLTAFAKLLVTRDGDYAWRIENCKWCGCIHEHGATGLDRDPRVHLCRRNAHCCTIGEFTKPKPESPLANAAEVFNLSLDDYCLVDADPRHTAELIESLEVHEDDVFFGAAIKEVV